MANRRCKMCAHWRQIKLAPKYGECVTPLPWWHDTLGSKAPATHRNEGGDCAMWTAKADG